MSRVVFARYTPPPPRPAPACEACRVFGPEVLVPAEACGRDGAPVEACWMCAHVITEHGVSDLAKVADAMERCTCGAEHIFPADVLATRRAARGEAADYAQAPEHVGRDSARWAALRARLEPHGQAIASTRVPARERQAQARAAASKTSASRASRRS